MTNTKPSYEPIIEVKVKWATAIAAGAGFVISLLNQYVFGGDTPDAVEGIVESLIAAALTGLAGFLGGYEAPHTPRRIIDINGKQ